MGAMVTNHVYNKEHNTTSVNIKLTAHSLLVCKHVCAFAVHSICLQEHEVNHYINSLCNQSKVAT